MTRIILLTGLAGAGKTTTADILEDMGFNVIENLPTSIVADVVDQMRDSDTVSVAIAVDLRDEESIESLFQLRHDLREQGDNVDILFLDADDDTLIRRYEQTRRPHPHISSGVLTKGIEYEREMLSEVLANADVHIDTSKTNPTQLGQQLATLFGGKATGTTVVVNSFGFKYGMPRDADFVFDVRFLPNPFWEPTLKEKTGLESGIQDYVKRFDLYDEYIASVKKTLDISLREFSALGKGFVTVAFGCTGGFHRSVTVANDIATWLRNEGHRVIVVHRELDASELE